MKIWKKKRFFGFFIVGTVLLASCSPALPVTPTEDTNLILTQVAQTVAVGFTQTEASKPRATPTNTLQPTYTRTATLMISPTPFTINTPTFQIPLPGAKLGPDILKYIGDITVPDGTVVGSGDILDKIWEIQNVGTSTWNENYRFYYCAGLPLEMVKDALPKLFVKLPGPVKPSEKIQISFSIITPQANAHYRIYFQLLDEKGNKIPDEQGNGCSLWADFTVIG
jgi:hypothetical protein